MTKQKTEKPAALLINPPVYDFSLFDLFHRPLGLLRIGRWLKEAGYHVSVVDALDVFDTQSIAVLGNLRRKTNGTGKFFKQRAVFDPESTAWADNDPAKRIGRRYSRYGIIEESFAAKIAAFKPDIVLVTSGMTYWFPGVVETVRIVRKQHPRVPVVVGGVYASLLTVHCVSNAEPDHVVAGTAWEELKRILGQYNLPVPGKSDERRVLLDPRMWRGAGVLKLNEGCPLRCDYCASSLLCPRFTPGNGKELMCELREVAEACQINSFAFYDDALMYGKERGLIPFLNDAVESGLDLSFYLPNAIHLGLLDLETASLMKRAGFKEIRLGFESSSPVFHEQHDEKVEVDDFSETIGILHEAGFSGSQVTAYILAGLPGQRVGEVEESVRFVTASGVRASIAEYSPVPGTGLWKASAAASMFPIEDEPLYQNNSIMPLQWDGFTTGDLQRVKDLSRELSPPRADT